VQVHRLQPRPEADREWIQAPIRGAEAEARLPGPHHSRLLRSRTTHLGSRRRPFLSRSAGSRPRPWRRAWAPIGSAIETSLRLSSGGSPLRRSRDRAKPRRAKPLVFAQDNANSLRLAGGCPSWQRCWRAGRVPVVDRDSSRAAAASRPSPAESRRQCSRCCPQIKRRGCDGREAAAGSRGVSITTVRASSPASLPRWHPPPGGAGSPLSWAKTRASLAAAWNIYWLRPKRTSRRLKAEGKSQFAEPIGAQARRQGRGREPALRDKNGPPTRPRWVVRDRNRRVIWPWQTSLSFGLLEWRLNPLSSICLRPWLQSVKPAPRPVCRSGLCYFNGVRSFVAHLPYREC